MNASGLLLVNFISSGLFVAVYHQAGRRCDKGLFIMTVGVITLIISIPLFCWEAIRQPVILDFLSRPPLGYWVLLIIPVLGALFAMHSYSRLKISEALPTYVHLPLQRLQLLLVIGGAFLFFGESQSPLRLFGIAIAFVPILLSVVRKSATQGKGSISAVPLFWLAAVVLLGALLQLSSKLALHKDYSIAVPALCFVILSNLGSTLVSLGPNLINRVPVQEAYLTLTLGVLAGILNVVTLVTLTLYLVAGDASIIYTTSAMGFLVPTALYQLWGTEPVPSKLDWIAYACALFAVITLVS